MSYLAICAIGGGHDDPVHALPRRRDGNRCWAHSGARAFIGLEEMGDFRAAQTVLDLRRRIATLEHVLVLGEAPDGARSFAGLIGAAAHDLSDGPAAADPFLLLYTSGTSSGPQGRAARLPGHHSETPVSPSRKHGITAADRILSAAPFGASLWPLHLSPRAGGWCVHRSAAHVHGRRTSPRVLGAESVTVLFAAPAHVAACLGAGRPSAGEAASVRLAVMAGSAVLPAVVKGLKERVGDGHVTQLWGMTELQGRSLYPARRSDRESSPRRRAGRAPGPR